MSFETFVNNIINAFNTVFPHIASYINLLISNNFIKLIIYLSLCVFVINVLFTVIKFIYAILNNKHDKQETREMLNGTSESVKNGGNIKSKDIYW